MLKKDLVLSTKFVSFESWNIVIVWITRGGQIGSIGEKKLLFFSITMLRLLRIRYHNLFLVIHKNNKNLYLCLRV